MRKKSSILRTFFKIAATGAGIYFIFAISFLHGTVRRANQTIQTRSFDLIHTRSFDPSRRCSISGKMYGCTPVQGAVVSSGKEPAPSAKCLSGKAAWGVCSGGRFLCEMDSDIQGTDMSMPTELQSSVTGPAFCSIDKSWWVCSKVSTEITNHPIGARAFDCLGEDSATGICNHGESLCLLSGGTWLEMHVPIVPSETASTTTLSPDDLTKLFHANKRSQSGEDEYMWNSLFYGKTRGSFLEMGALDGELYSNTWAFEKALNWTGVLIEANPTLLRRIKAKRPAQRVASAAVCEEPTVVEFIFPDAAGDDKAALGAVGGLPQYLTKQFLDTHYGDRRVVRQRVACVPLMRILDGLGARDFDLFSLDVEGAELTVLRTIDFARVRIGVLCVEANGLNPAKDAEVRTLLAAAGYSLHASFAGSDWFTARGFRPSAAPRE